MRRVVTFWLFAAALVSGSSWFAASAAALDTPGRGVTLRAVAAADAAMSGPVWDADGAERSAEPTALARPVAVLYGDSLAWEAREAFSSALAGQPGVEVHQRTFGGTAICDWLDQKADDVVELQPGIVVVQFSGNNFTPCMRGESGRPLTGDELVERYAADARAVASIFEGSDVELVFAGAPIDRDGSSRIGRINDVYRRLAADLERVSYVDAGASVLADGRWTATLPCLPGERCDAIGATGPGRNVVRSPDGLHFCPSAYDSELGVTTECPVWSSGAFRFGSALAQPVLDRL